MAEDINSKLERLKAAFASDGFDYQSSCTKNGWLGVSCTHPQGSGANVTYKHAYYVEGDHWTMGWLLGCMAEPLVASMTTEYRENVIDAFFDLPVDRDSGALHDLQMFLLKIVSTMVEKMKPDIPPEFGREIEGLHQGCVAANPRTKVTVQDLWELNIGVDAILAHVYTGELVGGKVSARHLQVPLFCNAYCAPGSNQRFWFGRDFMFPTADVFQDVACLIVYGPAADPGPRRRAFVSQTAPGIIGTLAAINSEGVAIGINMAPSPLCSPSRPGFNGLLLNRYCMELADTAEAAARLIIDAPRGVTWFYPIADKSGRALVVEAGMRLEEGQPFPYLDYVPRYYKDRVPGLADIQRLQQKYGITPPERGAIVREAGYTYPVEYLDWNKGLYGAFDRNWLQKVVDLAGDLLGILGALFSGKFKTIPLLFRKLVRELVAGAEYDPGAWGENGYINDTWTEENCPGPFYFAPQRETRPDVIVHTNMAVTPEMRLAAMHEWTAIVGGSAYNDIQWRYDELCHEVLTALADARSKGSTGLDDPTAWSVINFLSPERRPTYYNPDGTLKVIPVKGSVSLFDMTSATIKTLFGYYGDDPLTITLAKYLPHGQESAGLRGL